MTQENKKTIVISEVVLNEFKMNLHDFLGKDDNKHKDLYLHVQAQDDEEQRQGWYTLRVYEKDRDTGKAEELENLEFDSTGRTGIDCELALLSEFIKLSKKGSKKQSKK